MLTLPSIRRDSTQKQMEQVLYAEKPLESKLPTAEEELKGVFQVWPSRFENDIAEAVKNDTRSKEKDNIIKNQQKSHSSVLYKRFEAIKNYIEPWIAQIDGKDEEAGKSWMLYLKKRYWAL